MTQFAMVFPGQGSQTVGMLAELAAENPIIEATFKAVSYTHLTLPTICSV